MSRTLLTCLLLSLTFAVSLSASIPLTRLTADSDSVNANAFGRDQHGYLWIGNNGSGLMRFDGYSFERYLHHPQREDSISGNSVTDILVDSYGKVWIATDSGLSVYNRSKNAFERYQNEKNDPQRLESGRIIQILETQDRELWVLTQTAANKYDRKTDRFIRVPTDLSPTDNGVFNAFVHDLEGNTWLFESSNRFWKLDRTTGELAPAGELPGKEDSEKTAYRDSEGRIWIGSNVHGLYRLFPDNLEVVLYGSSGGQQGTDSSAISDLIEYPKGQLLIGLEKDGLSVLDLETQKFTHQSMGLDTSGGSKPSGVLSFYQDWEDILWVGTPDKGINHHNPKSNRFQNYQIDRSHVGFTQRSNVVCSIYEDKKRRILYGTDDGAKIIYPGSKQISKLTTSSNTPSGFTSDTIRSIDQNSRGQYFFATRSTGVIPFNETDDGQFALDAPAYRKLLSYGIDSTWDMTIDTQDRMWITTPGAAILMLDPELNLIKRFHLFPHGVKPFAPLIAETEPGEIIISCLDGFLRYNETSKTLDLFIKLRHPTTIVRNPRSGLYYAGSDGLGLSVYNANGEKVNHVSIEDGLPNHKIQSIHITNDDDVWVGTKKGVGRWIVSDNEFRVYNNSDGAVGNQMLIGAICQATDGRIYFGTTAGLTSLLPSELTLNQLAPKVYITQIAIDSKPIDFHNPDAPFSTHPQALESLSLPWQQGNISFDFVGISLTNSVQNQFAYLLEGHDKDWRYTNWQNRRATYSNLPSGEYTLRVKASNNDEIWSEKEARLPISIVPPFWRKNWFYALEALLVLSVIYAMVLYRERRFRKQRLKLAQLIQDKTKELQTHKDNLEEIVDERTKELVIAKDKAEESDRLKSQFLANFSHEIRTPLNAVLGFTSIIQQTDPDEESRINFMSQIENNSLDLLSLIEDILDFSIIASNQLKIIPAPFSLNEFIRNLESNHSIKFAPKPIDLRILNELEDLDLQLLADRGRAKQILDNLLGNALKFTEEGFVELRVRKQEDMIVFEVHDSGHGIPDDEIDIIFDKFVKLQEDDTAARRGVGLGLAISKHLAQLMNGDLSVKSEYGKGSIFSLEIPLKTAERDAEKDQDRAADLAPLKSLGNKKVLVIEDEPASYLYLEAALTSLGLVTTWAASGFEGIGALRESTAYDLIFLDIKMPGMDGYETLKNIREIDPNIHVIAQTAYARHEDEQRIRQAGFDGYITKPIQRNALIETTHRHLLNEPVKSN